MMNCDIEMSILLFSKHGITAPHNLLISQIVIVDIKTIYMRQNFSVNNWLQLYKNFKV